jgi:uncharacterized protein (TIGR00156 family)
MFAMKAWARNRRCLIAALSLVVISTPFTVVAEYQGPGAKIAQQNVSQIVLNGEDGMPVTLRGRIVQKVAREKYLFTDETAKVRLHIEDKKFPASAINDQTRLEIFGKIEKDFVQDLEIDVDKVRVLP